MAPRRLRAALLTALSAAFVVACAAFSGGSDGEPDTQGGDGGADTDATAGTDGSLPDDSATPVPDGAGGGATTGEGPPCDLDEFPQESRYTNDFESDAGAGFGVVDGATFNIYEGFGGDVARVDCAHGRSGHCLRATIAEDEKDSEARLRAMVDFGKTPTRTKLCTRIYLEAALDTLSPNQWVTLFGLSAAGDPTAHAALRSDVDAGVWFLEGNAASGDAGVRSDAYLLGSPAITGAWHTLMVATDWSGANHRVSLALDGTPAPAGTARAALSFSGKTRAVVSVGLEARDDGFPAATAWFDDFAIGWE